MEVDHQIYGQAGKRLRRNEEKLRNKEEDEVGEGERSQHQRSWHSERIFRVSRATGGKDRHSKVITAKGLRDRRVRLSVSTAIQFYDIQDRLGFDQPSKAIEWLIDAAAADIAQLPLLNDAFLDAAKQTGADEGRPTSSEQQNQHLSLSKSACSSPSETSKGSVLSLSRSEIRVKARERARDRTAKEKKESHLANPKSVNLTSQGSFTELLTSYTAQNNPLSTARQSPFFAQTHHHQNSYLNSDNLDHIQQLSLLQDHFMPAGDYNLNFSISSAGIAGINRGTLQSNSVSMAPHLQRFSSPAEGQNLPFFAAPAGENQFLDGHLQICYGNSNRHSDFKGKN